VSVGLAAGMARGTMQTIMARDKPAAGGRHPLRG
jgi:hypothetical protein